MARAGAIKPRTMAPIFHLELTCECIFLPNSKLIQPRRISTWKFSSKLGNAGLHVAYSQSLAGFLRMGLLFGWHDGSGTFRFLLSRGCVDGGQGVGAGPSAPLDSGWRLAACGKALRLYSKGDHTRLRMFRAAPPRRIFARDEGQWAVMVAKANRLLNLFMASWKSLTVDWRLFLKRLRQCR